MNLLRKWMGVIWMLLGPISVYYLVKTAFGEIARHPIIDTKIQWGVFIAVAVPIAAGMIIFGWYAWKDEYKR